MSPFDPEVLLRAVALTRTYPAATGRAGELVLFRALDLELRRGEMLAVVGQSGSGKSSLLHLLAALDRPTAGEVWCGERRVDSFSAAEAAAYRNREIGYVWQFHYLLPEFSAAENVAMPLLAAGVALAQAMQRAHQGLETVGLAERAANRPGELSGGEQQRVSLARALITNPRILLADEPTGDLDGTTADAVFHLIQQLHRQHGLTSILVTHNPDFASRCDRVLRLRDGHLEPQP